VTCRALAIVLLAATIAGARRYVNVSRPGAHWRIVMPLWPFVRLAAAGCWAIGFCVVADRRRHREQCVACGYDFASLQSAACPECGRRMEPAGA